MRKQILLILAGVALVAGAGQLEAAGNRPTRGANGTPIDLVICLDTSGSMTNLIDSARGRLWDIVTELSKAQPTPSLRVGLLTYGTPGTSTADQGWVVKQVDLTNDLDSMYGKMMGLTTEGGDEFVGWVLDDAISTMSWSEDARALKLIFVAGNESADQGSDQRNFRYVTEQAREKDIVINPIYAGDREQGIHEMWAEVTNYGRGYYLAIDAEHGTIQTTTPFDAALRSLNTELNSTYIPYGAKGAAGLANQRAQDANARKLGVQSCSSRVAAKGCGLYTNAVWDLVDATQQEDFKLASLKSQDLPEEMRSMTIEQRRAYIEGMRAVRQTINKKITATNTDRQAYLSAESRKDNAGKLSLDVAMLQALRDQARTKGFSFPAAPLPPAELMEPTVEKEDTPELPESFLENINALVDALPVLVYRVGAYETKHQEFATILANHTGTSIGFGMGGQVFATKAQAAEGLLPLLKDESSRLQTIEVVHAPDSPFVYTEALRSASGQQKGKPRYRLGGIDFPSNQAAETAAARIRSMLAGPTAIELTATRAGDARMETASAQLTSQIRAIAVIAARAFIDLGC